jgi:DNA-binding NarL/FixJ family response regulator
LEGFGFSSREEQVVRLLVTGASTSVIATELGISMGTVKKHLENVYQKTGVHGRGPLTAYVLDISPG